MGQYYTTLDYNKFAKEKLDEKIKKGLLNICNISNLVKISDLKKILQH